MMEYNHIVATQWHAPYVILILATFVKNCLEVLKTKKNNKRLLITASNTNLTNKLDIFLDQLLQRTS